MNSLDRLMKLVDDHGRVCARWIDRKPTSTEDTPITDLTCSRESVATALRDLVAQHDRLLTALEVMRAAYTSWNIGCLQGDEWKRRSAVIVQMNAADNLATAAIAAARGGASEAIRAAEGR